jgi:hypothetical protein
VARRFDCRRVKLHHNYTISELGALIGAHKQTIGRRIAAGLKTTNAKRPFLIHGADFRAFMKARVPIKRPCQLGEFPAGRRKSFADSGSPRPPRAWWPTLQCFVSSLIKWKPAPSNSESLTVRANVSAE